ncbi:hypothetical protein [Methanoculleus sp.]|uniref:hypothetical protein n=1 Tax=Methanoculleus sp. TaxID=90427 RepID=UPI001BD26120|nr:hypothetical protein [Methanoculleus sp.]
MNPGTDIYTQLTRKRDEILSSHQSVLKLRPFGPSCLAPDGAQTPALRPVVPRT